MATRAPGPRPLPIGVIGRVSRLARELEQRLEPVYREHGLEAGWHDVLAALRRSGAPYRLRPTEFSDALMLTSSGTTKRLDRLEQAGLITRGPDPDDRRGTLITLTAAGLALSTPRPEAHLDNERRLLSALTDAGAEPARRPAAQAPARPAAALIDPFAERARHDPLMERHDRAARTARQREGDAGCAARGTGSGSRRWRRATCCARRGPRAPTSGAAPPSTWIAASWCRTS